MSSLSGRIHDGSRPPQDGGVGAVDWLVADALHLEVPIPVISQSVMQPFASRDDRRLWARAIAMMRHGSGGHPYGQEEAIRRERQAGRVGGWPAGTAAKP